MKRYLHIKRVPKLYFSNNEIPNVSIPTHELFTKTGFFTHPKPGLVNWLNIGLSSINKIKKIIHHRMKEIDGEEINLSLLSHSSLWEKTNRWSNNELFKLKDSNLQNYCLVATCEEEITQFVKENLKSYKNLPITYYQINEKFRDEKRPRSGLLRGREFIMKDAYSFDINEANAMQTYEKVIGAYYKIFQDLKIPFVKAEADTGDIGGSLSHEWHYLHKSAGEDTLFTCNNCNHSSNIEKTLSYPKSEEEHSQVDVKYFTTTDQNTLICAYWPNSRILNPQFIKEEIPDLDLSFDNQQEILNIFSNEDTLINKKIVRIMDSRLNSRSNFPDFPINFINRSLMTTLTDIPIVLANEGEVCFECEEGTLDKFKSIEVGHTFYLGDKYTKSLNCSIDLPNIGESNLVMGCYGIGVSRILAAIGEINRDSKGFNWPSIISPWDITIIDLNNGNEKFYELLNENFIDYRLDNRNGVGLGKKIKQSNLIGIPLTIIIGKNYPIIEIEIRGKRYSNSGHWQSLYQSKDFHWQIIKDTNQEKHLVHINGLVKVIKSLLKDM
ncbi:prolyl-tRNA synthetase [Hyphopichia burtonii NRRL Y-1933]|uniref:proline--tRNA ligase n=1 Tax=Hyphopichia burtonii NRRL Y-1933 TaxID=984485 RepID=A0A1E4RKR4_9ASCO|nr:prolyl-tRNA synthetase [Hyphopichia burtonii NRRL Y-1933]ODV67843.1 prolyl-tRNA synthetase [Hyphopichia burtonii NRRL Y-1933]